MSVPAPTALEERLTTALAARAGQVTAADLEPAGVPEPPHRWVRVLLATAATVALIVGGVALWQPGGGSAPDPVAPTPSPAAEPLAIGGDLLPAGERLESDVPAWGDDGRITAFVRGIEIVLRATANDTRASGRDLLRARGQGAAVEAEVLRGTDGSVGVVAHLSDQAGSDLRVFTVDLRSRFTGPGWKFGRAEAVSDTRTPPFRSGFAGHRGADRRLVSWVAPDGHGYTLVVPERQRGRAVEEMAGPAEVWRWTLTGDALQPSRLDGLCLGDGVLAPCAGPESEDSGPTTALPQVVPAASQFTSEREYADAAPRVGTLSAMLRPEVPALEIAAHDGFGYTPELPGPATHLGRTGVLAPDGSAAFLVGTSDGTTTTVTAAVGRYRDRRGELVYSVLELGDAPGAPPLADGDVRLEGGSGRPAREVALRTWVAFRGSAYTLVLPEGATSLRGAAGPVEVWRWDIEGKSLRPTRLDGLCLDEGKVDRC